ncbi:hypothetical protein EYF80_023870 [Liparis tanakae]|uniref:Uncharacterized protein n=1 Tax=Liparis tanakae TaxID=230148 RepID=A0A4Z2HJV0_9TELE|nr:hypothetical protein EYF80_023870 [Liparis tanakae]
MGTRVTDGAEWDGLWLRQAAHALHPTVKKALGQTATLSDTQATAKRCHRIWDDGRTHFNNGRDGSWCHGGSEAAQETMTEVQHQE